MATSTPTGTQPVKKAPRSSLLRACERCRRRKIRCDEFFPCAACTRLGVQCKVPQEERAGERSQNFLEKRIKRLESLLAQQESQNQSQSQFQGQSEMQPEFNALSPSSSTSGLRLQIPNTPGFSFSPSPHSHEGYSPSPSSDYNPNIAFSHTSSPIDFASPGAGSDFPPWSTPNSALEPSSFTHQNPNGFLDFPAPVPRRANSFPFTNQPGNEGQDISIPDFNFEDFSFPVNTNETQSHDQSGFQHQDVPAIPTIEVTSYDPSSFPSSPNMNPMPDLSVGSWSGPPSPSFTAYSGNEDFLDFSLHSQPNSAFHSRRSSMAFSDRGSFDFGDDGLKPQRFHSRNSSTVSNQGEFPWGDDGGLKPSGSGNERLLGTSRPRSRSDVFPQSTNTRYSTPAPQSPVPEISTPVPRLQIGAVEQNYIRTFFQSVYSFFPIVNPGIFRSAPDSSSIDRASQALVLAIGAQFQSNCNWEEGDEQQREAKKYFSIAQQSYNFHTWTTEDGLQSISAHLLLLLHNLLSNTQKESLWILNALICSSIINLGLNSKAEKDINEEDRSVLFAAYVLDKIVALKTEKKTMLRSEDLGDGMRGVREGVEGTRKRVREGFTQGEDGWRGVLEWYRLGT